MRFTDTGFRARPHRCVSGRRDSFLRTDAAQLRSVFSNTALKAGTRVLWYASDAPDTVITHVHQMVDFLAQTSHEPLLAVPWDTARGAFPDEKNLALPSWTGKEAVRQACVQVQELVVITFVDAT